MYYELFRIKDGEVQPLNAREANLKEVRIIVQRDKGSNGDSDGRKKLYAYKELGMVYWIADFRSPGRMEGYEDEALIDHGKRNFNLPETWRPDDVVLRLIKMYEANNDGGVAAATLTEIASTFNLILRTVKAIKVKLNEKLNSANVTEAELEGLINMSNTLLKLTVEIPKKIKEIDVAKEMLKHIEDKQLMGRGNVDITSSMI